MTTTIQKALDEAIQLAEIASDWNLDEVEIDGEMVSIYDLQDRFKVALAAITPPAPDWSQAPAWSNWWAMDANTSSYWYEYEPEASIYGWADENGRVEYDKHDNELPLGVDWRLLKERRPA